MQTVLSSVNSSPLFENTLIDLIKAIRSHKDNEIEFISSVMVQLKKDLTSNDKDVKANTIEKLFYLQMLGFDISFAAFTIVEVMSQPSFAHKRIGYLAASTSFTSSTEVVLLTIQLFKKAFTSASDCQYEIGSALNCLSSIATPELAPELLSDLYSLLNSSKPYIRKKAILVLYSLFISWPKALRLSFTRLKEKLEDSDSSVVSAAVNVIAELSSKNPSAYLPLAPILFKILITSNSNWVLIKVVKILGSLIPHEPRLGKKLLEPLTNIINTTNARSLMYECIETVIMSKISSKSILLLCLEKLKGFLENQDQNLKYLGLLGLRKMVDFNSKYVTELKDLIIGCINDEDISIRMRALDLISELVTPKNLIPIVRRLLLQLMNSEGSYRAILLERIIDICSRDHYANTEDFSWYISTLVETSHIPEMPVASAIRIHDQLIDVIVRVAEVREFGVQQMISLLLDNSLSKNTFTDPNRNDILSLSYFLAAAAWIVGEFSSQVTEPIHLINSILIPSHTSLPSFCQSLFIQATLKLFVTFFIQDYFDFSKDISCNVDSFNLWMNKVLSSCRLCISSLNLFEKSSFIEVQERAALTISIFTWIQSILSDSSFETQGELSSIIEEFKGLFRDELKPVHPKAQSKVLSHDFDITVSLGNLDNLSDSEKEDIDDDYLHNELSFEERKRSPPNQRSLSSQLDAIRAKHENDPFYLRDSPINKLNDQFNDFILNDEDIKEIPIKKLEEVVDLLPSFEKKSSHKRYSVPQKYTVKIEEEGADIVSDEEDRKKGKVNDTKELSNIDLFAPLEPDEVITMPVPYSERLAAKQVVKQTSDRKLHKHHHKHKINKKNSSKSNDVIHITDSKHEVSVQKTYNEIVEVLNNDAVLVSYHIRLSSSLSIVLSVGSKIDIKDGELKISNSSTIAALENPIILFSQLVRFSNKKTTIGFEVLHFEGAQEVSCVFQYTLSKENKPFIIPFIIRFPCSSFILPIQISIQELCSILDENKDLLYSKTINIRLSTLNLADALKVVSRIGRVHLIKAINYTASFFGRVTIGKIPLVVLLKANQKSDNELTIEVKSLSKLAVSQIAKQFQKALN